MMEVPIIFSIISSNKEGHAEKYFANQWEIFFLENIVKSQSGHAEKLFLNQAFCPSSYFRLTCKLQAELVCLDWVDKM